MSEPTFSVVLNHAPWAKDRVQTCETMQRELDSMLHDVELMVHDTDYRAGGPSAKDKPVDFTLAQWRWAAKVGVTHHVFMTDDLDLAPGFLEILSAMCVAAPGRFLGLLSNHPKVPELLEAGHRWYRTNSWVVGPCYVVPHVHMVPLLAWAEKRGASGSVDKLGWSDDSELNEWITYAGPHEAYHPIPTPIEHKRSLSTWGHTGHGDDYSHERVSWRSDGEPFPYLTAKRMRAPAYWTGAQTAPMLGLP